MQKKNKPKSPLQKLYQRQQPKVNAKATTGQLLTTFAEQDHRRIAALIEQWLRESEQRTGHRKGKH